MRQSDCEGDADLPSGEGRAGAWQAVMSLRNKLRRQFVSPEWCTSHKTDSAVAVAIHAIADASRSPEQIWEVPTPEEIERVRSIVRDLVLNDYFQFQALGYQWGKETITLA
jgi:hypothetical protein